MHDRSPFACSHCGGILQDAGHELTCVACARRFSVQDGMPDFSHDAEFYWGELERETMGTILSAPEPVDTRLREMLKEARPELREYLEHYALDRRRAGWKFLTRLPHDGCALDFGCGWGGLALSLAENLQHVYVADAVAERVQVARRRARERGLANVIGCVSSGWPRLPFPDGVFDLVVLNGVLEWLPESIPGRPPTVQQAFVAEVARVLKPEGQLYVGIENRFGVSYFKGKKEEHTWLPYVSLLPRPVARWYHRRSRKSEYRAYTYGRAGLRRMMKRAGFAHVAFYCPYPDYRTFSKLVDLDDRRWIARAFTPHSAKGRAARWAARWTGALKWLANSFGVVSSRRKDPPPSFLGRLQTALHRNAILPQDTAVRGYEISAAACVQVRFALPEEDRLLTVPLDGRAATRIRRELARLGELDRDRYSPDVAACLPSPASGEFEGVIYKLEPFVEGDRSGPGETVAAAGRKATGLDWLGRFHAATLHEMTGLPADLSRSVDLVSLAFEETRRDRYVQALQGFEGQALRRAFVHGDFHPGNVLVHKHRGLAKVIDWDLAMPDGLPLWDVLTWFCHDAFERGDSWPVAYEQAAQSMLSERSNPAGMETYLKTTNLRPVDIHAAILSFPVVQAHHKTTYGDGRTEVITRGLAPVLDRLLSLAEGAW